MKRGDHEPVAAQDADLGTVDGTFQVDVSPDVSALLVFKNLTFTPWYALGEFVDNAITSALKHLDLLREFNGPDYRLRVDIEFTDEGDLLVRDNAAGISTVDFSRALKTGLPPADTSVGLSIHGAGMKAAAFWWGGVLEVDTWPVSEPHGWRVIVDVDAAAEGDSGLVSVVPIPARGYPGTTVKVSRLWQKVPKSRTLSTIKAYLPSIYRMFLREAPEESAGIVMDLKFMGQALSYEEPVLLDEPFWFNKEPPEPGTPSRLWRRDVHMQLASGREIAGWVGLRAVMSRDLGGFFLHFRGKGVAGVSPVAQEGERGLTDQSAYKPRPIFGQRGSYRDQTIVGEFNVSDFGKSLTTDSVTWSVADEEEFVARILELLQDPDFNMWAMAENMRRGKKRRDARQTQEDETDVSVIVTEFSAAVAQHGIDHVAPEEVPALIEAGEASESFTVNDREGHEHHFKVVMVADRSAPLLRVEGTAEGESLILINEMHPALDAVAPVSGPALNVLTRLCLALGAAEVFSSDWDRSATRRKFNEILDIQSRPLPSS